MNGGNDRKSKHGNDRKCWMPSNSRIAILRTVLPHNIHQTNVYTPLIWSWTQFIIPNLFFLYSFIRASLASNEYLCKYVQCFERSIKPISLNMMHAFFQFYGHPHSVVYSAYGQLNNNHSLQSILHFSFIGPFDYIGDCCFIRTPWWGSSLRNGT